MVVELNLNSPKLSNQHRHSTASSMLMVASKNCKHRIWVQHGISDSVKRPAHVAWWCTQVLCAVERDTLSGRGSNLCSGASAYQKELFQPSRIALTGRIDTGPPCSVGRPTADAPVPAATDRPRALQTPTDDDRRPVRY